MRVVVVIVLILAWVLLAWLCVVTPRDMQAARDEGRGVNAIEKAMFSLSSGVTRFWYGVVPLLLVVTGAAFIALRRENEPRGMNSTV